MASIYGHEGLGFSRIMLRKPDVVVMRYTSEYVLKEVIGVSSFLLSICNWEYA